MTETIMIIIYKGLYVSAGVYAGLILIHIRTLLSLKIKLNKALYAKEMLTIAEMSDNLLKRKIVTKKTKGD